MPEEHGGESRVFTKSTEDQAAELEWLHTRSRHESPADREARNVIARYRERIPTLGAAIEGWEVSMQTMRDAVDKANEEARQVRRAQLLREGMAQTDIETILSKVRGFPDEKTRDAYLKTRKDLTDAHKETMALQDRIRNIAEPLPGTPDVTINKDLAAEAKSLMDQMEPEFSGLETAFGSAITAHDAWRERNRNRLWGNRMQEDAGETKERPPLNREHYEARIAYLQSLAATLSADMESLTNPSTADIAVMMARLRELYGKMLEYEHQKAEPFVSDKRADVLGTLKQLREQLKGLAQTSRGQPSSERVPRVESEERVNAHWDKLEKVLMPSVGAFEEIQQQVQDGRLKPEDLQEARQYMLAMYERVHERIAELEGLTPSEVATLEERARARAHIESVPAVEAPEADSTELEQVKHDDYDRSVRKLMDAVGLLVTEADDLEGQGKLTLEARQGLRERLRELPARLDELDQSVGEYTAISRDRRDLIAVMKELRDKLEFYVDAPAEPDDDGLPEIELEEEDDSVATPVSVRDAHHAYSQARAAYSAVQHQLTVEQRQQIRARLVGMRHLVRQARLAHAIAHATEHAPALAHATLASIPAAPKRFEVKTMPSLAAALPTPTKTQRGLFGVLGDAFRLK